MSQNNIKAAVAVRIHQRADRRVGRDREQMCPRERALAVAVAYRYAPPLAVRASGSGRADEIEVAVAIEVSHAKCMNVCAGLQWHDCSGRKTALPIPQVELHGIAPAIG